MNEQLKLMRSKLKKLPKLYELLFPHWKLNMGESIRIRFLPDGNKNNTLFWTERQTFSLDFEFRGEKIVVQVPCMEMYGQNCLIQDYLIENYDRYDPVIRRFWRKRCYFLQGIINGTDATRVFKLDPYLFAVIKDLILDEDNDINPVDFDSGLDFILTNVDSSKYEGLSHWHDKRTRIDRSIIKNVYNLDDFLPKMPSEELHMLHFQLFLDSIDGVGFDMDKYKNIKYTRVM